jgi:hypothetical protein
VLVQQPNEPVVMRGLDEMHQLVNDPILSEGLWASSRAPYQGGCSPCDVSLRPDTRSGRRLTVHLPLPK